MGGGVHPGPRAELDPWVSRLSSPGPEQDGALVELRRILTSRLHRAFASKPGVEATFIEDVVQDALVAILESLATFQGRSRFTTWATTIAVRLGFAKMRRRHWQHASLDHLLDEGAEPMTERSDAPSDVVGNKQLVDALYVVIDGHLTQRQRTALLAELKGMPQEEIARHMGSNRNAIYKLTHDARRRLKEALLAAGYSAADLSSLQGDTQ